MEVGKMSSTTRDNHSSKGDDDDGEVVMPPGFRFHPTDEELVGFYLRREVEKKPISIELIKRVDIYKYDPWDLPRVSSTVGDKEWYFFCIRGRKYRNSIRPNRVTGSGFWKATGIDKPIYGATNVECIIGLKKSLVYYRGSAGKGVKTDWMMHEFRLPPTWKNNNNSQSTTATATSMSRNITQEAAEVWTLCRIFKRNASHKKHILVDWNEEAAAAAAAAIEQSPTNTNTHASSSKIDSFEYSHQNYMNLEDLILQQKERKPDVTNHVDKRNDQLLVGQQNSSSSWNNLNGDDDAAYFFRYGNNWDELRSVVGLAIDSSINVYDRVQ